MATAADLHRIALSLTGTTEAPHFDRIAFKAARIYVTLASDRRTANLKLSPEEQEFKCMLAPDAFSPVPNAWGKQGWTTVTLAKIKVAELKDLLETAWRHTVPSSHSKSKSARAAKGKRLDRCILDSPDGLAAASTPPSPSP